MMLFTLGAYVQGLIDAFKTRVSTTFGVFESESCLKADLDDLNNKGILQDAVTVLTPNAFNEGVLHAVKGNTITSTPYNLISYSESFALWSTNAATTSITSTTNPFGLTQDVVLFSETTANSAHRLNSTLLPILSAGDIYTASLYVKKGSGATSPDIVQLYLLNGFNLTSYANFNINTGVVTSVNLCTATINNTGLSAGWWRCTFTITSSVETTNCSFNFAHTNNNPTASRAPSYIGTTTSNTLIWGSQLELSSSATTYQPIIYTPLLQQGYSELVRPSTATVTDSTGLIIEVPKENLFNRSEQFETGVWTKSLSSVEKNVEIAPDGSLTSELFKEDTTTGRHRLSYNSAVSVVSGQTYNISVYVKKASQEWIQLNPVTSLPGFSVENWANFNLTTGTIGNKGTGAVTSIEDYGNGWWRCSLDIVADVTQTLFLTLFVTTNNTDSGRYPSYLGTGVSCFYIWGAQMTLGSGVKPYYPTLIRQNTPRLDYSEGSCPTLILESSSTNLILRSEDFENASWIKSNINVTSNTEISPNGFMVSDTLTATANNAYITQRGQAITSNNPRVFSVWLKRKTGTGTISLQSGDVSELVTINNSTWSRVWIINNIMIGTYSSVGTSYTVTTSLPHGLINGDSIRFDSTSGSAADQNITSITVTSPTQFTFVGTSVTTSGNCNIISNSCKIIISTNGDEIYVWGAQLEVGFTSVVNSSYVKPTSYIPTLGSTVTRGSDSLTTIRNSTPQVTFYAMLKKLGGTNSSSNPLILFSNGPTVLTSTHTIHCSGVVNGLLNWYYRAGGGVTALGTNVIYSPIDSEIFKILVTVDNTSSSYRFNIWMDGSLIVSSTATVDASELKYISFGILQPVLYLNEYVSWDRVLTLNEIDSLFNYPYYNSGYTPINFELQNIINRAHAEGFTIPNTSILLYCDNLITDMKNDGFWVLSDVYFNFAYNDTNLSDFATINWKNPNGGLGLATLSGGLLYQNNGFKGNGSNGFINTNFNSSRASFNYTLDNAGRFLVVSEDATLTTMNYDGTTSVNRNNILRNTTTQHRINSSANVLGVSFNMIGVGLKSIMRDSSVDVRLQNTSNKLTTTQTSTILENSNQFILRSGTFYSDACVSNYYMGASLTTTQIDNFRVYYNTYLTNIGLTPYA